MRSRYVAILGLWTVTAGFSIYSATALHSALLPIVSFVLAACGTRLFKPDALVGTLRVTHETMEDQLVESSLGFSVRMTNTSLVYRENARSITILPFTEPGKPVAFRMAPNIPLAWDRPNGDNPVSPGEQEEIRRRISRCISFLPSTQLSWEQRPALRKKKEEMREMAEKTPLKK
jgi:hypothetical protein